MFMALVVWELSLVDLWIVNCPFVSMQRCGVHLTPPQKKTKWPYSWSFDFFLLLALTFLTFCIFIFFSFLTQTLHVYEAK